MFSKKSEYGQMDGDSEKSQGHSGFSFKGLMSKATEYGGIGRVL